MKKYLFLSCLFLLSCSDKPKDILFVIYKAKQDYSSLIYVRLSNDKKSLSTSPVPNYCDTLHLPKKINEDYYLATPGYNGLDVRAVVTSLNICSYKTAIPNDSIIKLIIDYDPFIEYYIPATAKSQNQMLKSNGAVDTAKVIDIINKNQFNDYFERLR